MLLILFVEICSEMSSKVIFWPNKCIFTLIWVPSNCTQMSQNPNHYLEPCPKPIFNLSIGNLFSRNTSFWHFFSNGGFFQWEALSRRPKNKLCPPCLVLPLGGTPPSNFSGNIEQGYEIWHNFSTYLLYVRSQLVI